jgi:hypothetical protein
MWRSVNVSVEGTSHRRSGVPCQDASRCCLVEAPDGLPVLIAVVADGAGSASRAADGAALACETLVSVATTLIASGELDPPTGTSLAEPWTSMFRSQVDALADSEGLTRRDFACTLLATVITDRGALFMQVGDGAIVVREASGDDFSWVFWPQSGEYANTTYFATDPALEQHLQIDVTSCSIDDVAMFSDGLQPLVLDYASRSTHAPFFAKMFHALRTVQPFDRDAIERSLCSYLDSSLVNERTDDDKTLLLASRISPPGDVQ